MYDPAVGELLQAIALPSTHCTLAGSKSQGMLLHAANLSTGTGRTFILAGEGKIFAV